MMGRCLTTVLLAQIVLLRAENCFTARAWNDKDLLIPKEEFEYGRANNPFHTELNTVDCIPPSDFKCQSLQMKSFAPGASDKRKQRPAVVILHGGNFRQGAGDENSPDVVKLATRFAAHGFFAATIQYRLMRGYHAAMYIDHADRDNHPQVVAVEDTRAAVRFLRVQAYNWRIDTSRIVVAGESAGAHSALWYNYMPVTQFPGKSGNPGFSDEVHATLSISGSLGGRFYCHSVDPESPYEPHECHTGYQADGVTIRDNTVYFGNSNKVPIIQVHGTADLLVPFQDGKYIVDQANLVKNMSAKLIEIPRAEHVPVDELLNVKDGAYWPMLIDVLGDYLSFKTGVECPAGSIRRQLTEDLFV